MPGQPVEVGISKASAACQHEANTGYLGGIKWRIWNKQDNIHLEATIRFLHSSQIFRSHCGTAPLEDQWHSSKGPQHWLLSALHSDILLDFQYWVQGVRLIWSFSQFYCIKIPTRVKGYRSSVAQMFPQWPISCCQHTGTEHKDEEGQVLCSWSANTDWKLWKFPVLLPHFTALSFSLPQFLLTARFLGHFVSTGVLCD